MPRNRYARRLLVTLGLFISLFALDVRPAFATHFRYATMFWERNLSYFNPLKPTEAKVTITIQVGMRWTYPSFTYQSFGPIPPSNTLVACAGVVTTATDWQSTSGGSCPPQGAYVLPTGSLGYGLNFNKAVTVVAENGRTLGVAVNVPASGSPAPGGYQFHGVVTQVIPTQDTFYAQATLDVLVDTANATTASPLVATWEDANRVSTLMDGNNDIPWIVGTAIDLSGPITRSAQSVSTAIVQVISGVLNTISLPVQVFDNMVARYRLATSAESGLTSVAPVSTSVFSLNSQTGQISFTPRTTGFYGVQFKVGAVDANGVVHNEVPLDMIFQAVPSSATYSVGLATGDGQTTYTATVPQPFSFTVNATLAPTNPAFTVTINNTVLPAGATFSQGSKSGGGPVTGTFNWTPSVTSTSSSVCFSATVTNGQTLVTQSTGSLCVTINLSPLQTTLTAFPASGHGGGPLALTAKLTRTLDGAPLPGRAINFAWSDPANAPWVADCPPAVTDSTGLATCIVQTDRIVLASENATYNATFHAIANELLQSSAGTNSVVLKTATTTLDPPTASTTPYNSIGFPVNVSTVLHRVDTDGGLFPPPGQLVSFTLTDPSGTQTVLTGATAAQNGVTTVTFPAEAAPVLGDYSVNVAFPGNALLGGAPTSPTTTFAMGQRLKLATSPATGGVNLPVVLQASLTDLLRSTPLSGRTVTFTSGTTVLTAVTDANGIAQVTTTFGTIGTFPFTASMTPNTSQNELNSQGLRAAETANGTATTTPAVATVLAASPFSGTSWAPGTLTATVTTSSSSPLSGVVVTFTLVGGGTLGTASTNSSGVASLPISPNSKVTGQYTASFAGTSGVYLASSATAGFVVANAPSTTVVTCTAPAIFNGSPLTPCTATVTGAGGLSQPLVATYTNNLNAGTATASASFAGDASHDSSTGSTTFAIAAAASAVVVSCPASATFTGAALTPCTAIATGDGGLSQPLSVTYAGNLNAGPSTASASFAGDANHVPSDGLATFTIGVATSSTVVSCPASTTFTGTALTPCTATVTGAGSLNQSTTVSYTNNVNAGAATASASFAGDANHAPSNGSATFAIGAAVSTTVVTCPVSTTFTGAALTPCTATITGADNLSQSATVSYTNNVNAGTATATASFAGDANHAASNGSATFAIGAAASTTVVTCPVSTTFTGAALTPCTATITGADNLSQSATVSYTNNLNAGTATASATFGGDANHAASNGSTTFTIGVAAATTVVSCPATTTFNGSPLTPCTATVTGDGGLNQAATVSYTNNVNAGTATASASFVGDPNHAASSSSATFTIGVAAATTVVSCPATTTFNGSPLTPCTATVTGDGGLNQAATVSYTNNVNAGTATASASFVGDPNHAASSSSATFTIGVAAATTVVSCPATTTFNGSALTPCTATVTGDGGLNQPLTVSYTNNIGAGSASASASFAGDANHSSSSGSGSFTIGPAASVTVVNCPATMTFTGTALTPCTATVTGDGGLTQSLAVTYANNVTAGAASADASYAGDANHTASHGAATFAIGAAASTTVVSCPVSTIFTGAAQAPCTATVTGVGGLNQSLAVSYNDNTAAGTASATASFAGDANHANSAGSASFAIGHAPSTVVVTCASGVTFNGSAQTPCTANVAGAGGLAQSASVSYSNNTAAGTASAGASYAGDANHDPSSGSATFAIGKASSAVTVTCANVTYNGSAQTPCNATVTGVGGLSQAIVVGYSGNSGAGIATATASYAGDGNHTGSSGTATFTIAKATPAIAWPTPAAVSYGTALATTQLDATSPVAGTFVYTPALGTVLGAGTQTLSVAFTPADTADYTGASASVTLAVNAASASSLQTLVSAVVTNPSVAASLNHTLGLAGGAPNAQSRAAHLNKFVRDVNNLVPGTLTQAQANLLIQVANTLY